MPILKFVFRTIILCMSFSAIAQNNVSSHWERSPPTGVRPSDLKDENIRTDPKTGAKFTDGQFISCFKSTVKYDEVVRIVKNVSGVVDSYSSLAVNCFGIHVRESKDGSILLKTIKKLKSRSEVVNAEPNYIGHGS